MPGFASLNGSNVIRGSVVRSLSGVWFADLVVDGGTAPAVASDVTLSFQDGAVTLVGSVARSGVYVDTSYVRIVGGKGTIGNALPPRWYYRNVPLSVPLRDLMTETGETLSTTSDVATLARVLTAWARPAVGGAVALDLLLTEVEGTNWRILADGTLWVGPDTWPTSTLTVYDVTDSNPIDDRIEIASDVPTVAPGTTFLGRHVVNVIDVLGADNVRTTIYFGN